MGLLGIAGSQQMGRVGGWVGRVLKGKIIYRAYNSISIQDVPVSVLRLLVVQLLRHHLRRLPQRLLRLLLLAVPPRRPRRHGRQLLQDMRLRRAGRQLLLLGQRVLHLGGREGVEQETQFGGSGRRGYGRGCADSLRPELALCPEQHRLSMIDRYSDN